FTQSAGTTELKLPPRAWGHNHFSMVLLTEFARTSDWHQYDLDAWDPAKLVDELKELHELIEFRPAAMAESLAQRQGFGIYFEGVLGTSPKTHPSMRYLMDGAMRIAQFQCMHHKNKFQRPRPTQLSPNLLPPVDVPTHSAFPSAHAT